MNRSEQINELAAALAKAQGQMRNPKWDAKNPQFGSKYATLGTVIDAIRSPLADNGLSILQTTSVIDGSIYLESTLLHISGQWASSTYPVRPMRQVKNEGWVPAEDPQSIGSALSYARRYSLEALVDMAEDDDDGNKASEHQPAVTTRPQAVASRPAPAQPARSTPTNGTRPSAASTPPLAAPVAAPSDSDEIDAMFVAMPKAPLSASADAPTHWIDNETTRKKFFTWVGDQGMRDEEVYVALNCVTIHQYPGTKADAMSAILAYLKRKFAAQAQRESTPQAA